MKTDFDMDHNEPGTTFFLSLTKKINLKYASAAKYKIVFKYRMGICLMFSGMFSQVRSWCRILWQGNFVSVAQAVHAL